MKEISLIVGGDGLIGKDLGKFLRDAGKSVLETTRRLHSVSKRKIFLDLAENVSGWNPPSEVSVAYLCAAVSSIARCEENPQQSARINVHNTLELANKLVSNGSFVVFLSSNLVFDGTIAFQKSDDIVFPKTEYGRQKSFVERQLLALGDLVAVVRLTKVISPKMQLLQGWIRDLSSSKPIYPFPYKVSPISLDFAVEALSCIGESRLSGIFQLSGDKDITYKEIGFHIARYLGVDSELVYPANLKSAGFQMRGTSSHTTLDTTRLVEELGIRPPHVWTVIDLFIQQNLRWHLEGEILPSDRNENET